MQQNQQLELEITDINHQGEGVARANNMVIFVPYALPGEKITVRIIEIHKNFARAMLTTLMQPDTHRQTPDCKLFGNCGGCHVQHFNYHQQLAWKTRLVKQSLNRIGGIDSNVVQEIKGMDNPWHYRNNVRFQVQKQNNEVVLGYFAPDTHQLVPVIGRHAANIATPCLLLHPDLNQVAEQVREVLEKYQSKIHLPRQLMLRRGSSGQIMVVFIMDTGQASNYAAMAREIVGINRVASAQLNHRNNYHTLAGQDYIVDEIDGLHFRIAAASFYQVNPYQTKVLYRQVLNYCALTGLEHVVDAYSGVGTIALYLARYAKSVRGYEITPQAVLDAKANAILNKLHNTGFFTGAVEKMLPKHIGQGYHPDIVVLDPPRSGCHYQVLKAIAAGNTRRIVYVSCNPATLARDLGKLTDLGYQTKSVQPVDMFPHTHHVETVVLMSRVEK